MQSVDKNEKLRHMSDAALESFIQDQASHFLVEARPRLTMPCRCMILFKMLQNYELAIDPHGFGPELLLHPHDFFPTATLHRSIHHVITSNITCVQSKGPA